MSPTESSYIVNVVMGPKFDNSSIYKDLNKKINFFEGYCWFKFNNLGLALGMALKFYASVTSFLKLKLTKYSLLW